LLSEKTVTKTVSMQKILIRMIYLTRIITVNDSDDDDIYTVLGKTDITVLRMTSIHMIYLLRKIMVMLVMTMMRLFCVLTENTVIMTMSM
jgi:hypothetical protein